MELTKEASYIYCWNAEMLLIINFYCKSEFLKKKLKCKTEKRYYSVSIERLCTQPTLFVNSGCILTDLPQEKNPKEVLCCGWPESLLLLYTIAQVQFPH
jgi:hypothetical protein